MLSTTRMGGVSRGPYAEFNLGYHVGDVGERVRQNRELLRRRLPPELLDPVVADQVHGVRCARVGPLHAGVRWLQRDEQLQETDALVTADAQLPMMILTADCLPIVVFDPVNRVLAAIHAGWRGLAAGVIQAAAETIRSYGQADTTTWEAWIGPGIGACCYEVGEEMAEFFPQALHRADGSVRLDLCRQAKLVLGSLGIPGAQIRTEPGCTACAEDRFFSHRRASKRGEPATGRQATIAWLEHR